MSTGFIRDATSFLEGAGYSRRNLVPDCQFTVRTDDGKLRAHQTDLVAFAHHPHDMRSACVAVFEARDGYQDTLASLRYLTVPLALVGGDSKVELWSIRKTPVSEPFGVYDRAGWQERLHTRLLDFSPKTITDAKADRIQLDFVDAGLEPWTRAVTDASLRSLLEALIGDGIDELAPSNRSNPSARKAVLRLIFSLFACRALEDKGIIPKRQTPREALEIAHGKFSENINPEILDSPYISNRVSLTMFRRLRDEFSFATLTTDILAHAYENVLVNKEGRHELGIYYTPKAVIDYIFRRLPMESIAQDDRVLWDPCCGSGSFLVAGFDRLGSMLPESWTPKERHQYLRKHLFGSDVDELARELASLALVLTDLHNHNGWDIREIDARTVTKRQLAAVPTIIATNLPFREVKLGIGKRSELSADILQQILKVTADGALLAVIMPQSFLDITAAHAAREDILEKCDVLEIALFPSAAFESATETAVMFLRKRHPGAEKLSITTVRESRSADFSRFVQNSSFTRTYPVDQKDWRSDELCRFRVSPLADLWKRLEGEPYRLNQFAEIKNGIQVKKNDRTSVAEKQRDNRDREYVSRLDALKPFAVLAEHGLTKVSWIRYGKQLHRRRDEAIFLPPKVLINSNRNPGSAWRLVAAVSHTELCVSDNFHAVIPKVDTTSAAQLAAVLNSPLANAWFDSRCRKRKIIQKDLRELPYPQMDAKIGEQLNGLVAKMEKAVVAKWKKCQEGMFFHDLEDTADTAVIQREIDDLVFAAYGLTPHERKHVISLMATDKRPG